MKNKDSKMNKSTKVLIVLIAIILIAGTIIGCTKGFNFDLSYEEEKRVEITIGKQFDRKDIKEITNQVFGKDQPVQIQEIEVYKDAVSITTPSISDEQKINLVATINEKYGTEIKDSDVTIEGVAHIRARDIVKPYAIPLLITTIIILVYLMIRYYKLNSLKVLLQSAGIIVLAQWILFAIMAITRMPIGVCTTPSILVVYVISLYICTRKFDEDLDKIKIENEKKSDK